MPTYLYCLLGHGNEPPAGLAGVGGAAVRGIAAGPLLAWVSTLAEPPRPSVESLQAHDAVTAAALATGETPVPVRFGQAFADDDACVAALRGRATALLRARDAVAGCVEMTALVRLPGEPPPPSPESSGAAGGGAGRAYLERLRSQAELERFVRGQSAPVRRRLTDAAAPFVRGEHVIVSSSPPLLTVSHLVPREAVAAYRQALSHLAAEGISPAAMLRGPSAPYSFVTVDER